MNKQSTPTNRERSPALGDVHECVNLARSPERDRSRCAANASVRYMSNNQVDETGSLGEASRSCVADAGDGVLAGAAAWTTINLPPGRYEVLCNIAGHYGSGTYAELDAVGNR